MPMRTIVSVPLAPLNYRSGVCHLHWPTITTITMTRTMPTPPPWMEWQSVPCIRTRPFRTNPNSLINRWSSCKKHPIMYRREKCQGVSFVPWNVLWSISHHPGHAFRYCVSPHSIPPTPRVEARGTVVAVVATKNNPNRYISFTPAEEDAFRTLARRPDVYDILHRSIAPNIHGSYTTDSKKALTCCH